MKIKTYYLDGASNTPVDKRVFKKMKRLFKHRFVGNSQSIHDYGRIASGIIEDSRAAIKRCLGDSQDLFDVYFSSGATESNNWVIQSLALHELANGMKRNKILVSSYEHSSVLNTCLKLKELGFQIIQIPVDFDGHVSEKQVRKLLDSTVLLVCVMAVNNELGTKNPINEIASTVHEFRANLLTDCTQALSCGGKSIQICDLYGSADYLTFSGHKIYGPTGVGCLLVKKSQPLYPLIIGGHQENGLRGGTHNIEGIVGTASALELLSQEDFTSHFNLLYSYLRDNLKLNHIPYYLNAVPDDKNIISLNFTDYFSDCSNVFFEQLADALSLQGIAVSAGSACEANEKTDDADPKPSHVLLALGIPSNETPFCIRISLTKYSNKKDIDALIKALILIKTYSN